MKKFASLLIACMFSMLAYSQSCTPYDFLMITSQWGQEVSWSITDDSGVTVYNSSLYEPASEYAGTICLEDGCFVLLMEDSFGDGWNGGSLQFNGVELTLPTGNIGAYGFGVNSTDSCDFVSTYGCTDPDAWNYDPNANVNDGSCQYPPDSIAGCTDPNALNYNPMASIDDGSCQYPIDCPDGEVGDLYICTFGNGQNVGFELIDDQGTIVFSQMGFANVTIEHIDVCLEEGVCYTANMSNLVGPEGWYNGYFWVNVNGVQIVQDELYDGEQYDSVDFSLDGTCGGTTDIFGCTDPGAWNFNPAATIDDGSCQYDSTGTDCSAYFEVIEIDPEFDVVYLWNGSIAGADASYLWDFGDGGVSFEEFPTYQYSEGGTYLICLTVFDQFCESTYCDTISYDPGGIIDGPAGSSLGWTINVQDEPVLGLNDLQELEEFNMFPVPADNLLNIAFRAESSEKMVMIIRDVSGKTLSSVQLNPNTGVNRHEVNTSELPAGLYMIQIQSESSNTVRTFNVVR